MIVAVAISLIVLLMWVVLSADEEMNQRERRNERDLDIISARGLC